MKRSMNTHVVLALMAVVVGFGLVGCKKKKSNNNTSSGGAVVPAPAPVQPAPANPNPLVPFENDPGLLGGDWTGSNSAGGELKFVVKEGNFYLESLSFTCDPKLASVNVVAPLEPAFQVNSKTGQFEGDLSQGKISGQFTSYTAANGVFMPVNKTCVSSFTWTATIKTPRPDVRAFDVTLHNPFAFPPRMNYDDGFFGTAITIDESLVTEKVLAGTNLVLTPNIVESPVLKFDHWSGDCSGSGDCAVTVNKNLNITMNYQLENVDGDYSGTNDKGETVTFQVQNHDIVNFNSTYYVPDSECTVDVRLDRIHTYPYDPSSYYLSENLGVVFSARFNSLTDITGVFITQYTTLKDSCGNDQFVWINFSAQRQ